MAAHKPLRCQNRPSVPAQVYTSNAASTAARSSAAAPLASDLPKTAVTMAMPAAPACKQAATPGVVMPPMATTGRCVDEQTSARPSTPMTLESLVFVGFTAPHAGHQRKQLPRVRTILSSGVPDGHYGQVWGRGDLR